MTGLELLVQLHSLSEEELNLTVYSYLPDYEDGQFARGVRVLTVAEEPYHKGDGPWTAQNAASDERLIFIS